MEILTAFITIGIISFLAAISPGPDLAVVTKNSLFGSRKIGVYTAIGVGAGILCHVSYSLLGIGLVIAQSILLFTIVKLLGAAYLLYLGIQLLRAKREVVESPDNQVTPATSYKAFSEGFFTNALNPKATLFFLSIFTQVIDPAAPKILQLFLGIEVAVIVGVWFVLLAFIVTHEPIRNAFSGLHFYIMKVMGAALIILGVKLAFATKD